MPSIQAVHDALVLPHAFNTLRCTIGQRVRLNDAARARVQRRGLQTLFNLGFETIGEVVAVEAMRDVEGVKIAMGKPHPMDRLLSQMRGEVEVVLQ